MSKNSEPQAQQAEAQPAPEKRSCRRALTGPLSWLPRIGLMLGIVLLPG